MKIGTHNRLGRMRARLGFVVLATDLVFERDLYDFLPNDIGIFVARVPMANDLTIETLHAQLDSLAHSAALLTPNAPPDVVCYACTSGTVVMGEAAVFEKLAAGVPGAKHTTVATCAFAAFRALGAQRIALATPYTDDINASEAAYFAKAGFDIVSIEGLGLGSDLAVSSSSEDEIRRLIRAADHPDAEVIFASCTGLHATGLITELEAELNKPVLTSNSVTMWGCMRLAGLDDNLAQLGALLAT